MALKPNALLLVILLIAPVSIFAQGNQQADFCAYTQQHAEAEHTLLRSPSVVTGISAPLISSDPPQSFVGLLSSPTDIRKAQLVMSVARRQCDLYDADQAAQLKIQYSTAFLEKAALTNRLVWLQKAQDELAPLLQSESERLAVENSTLQNVYAYRVALAKVESDRRNTGLAEAALYVPTLSDAPLRELVVRKQSADTETQKATAALNEQDSYSVIWEAGVHQPVRSLFNTGPKFYGNFTIKWNVSSRSRGRLLTNAVGTYERWADHDESGVTRKMIELQQQIEASLEAQESALKALLIEDVAIQENLSKIGTLDTAAAISFKNTLVIDRSLLQVEIGTATYRVNEMREYLSENF